MAWLREECRKLGVQIVPCSRLVEIADDGRGMVTGVRYKAPDISTEIDIPCRNVVLALGESTETVLQELFGDNGQLDFHFRRECQDWMTMENPWPRADPRIFRADETAGSHMDIRNRKDGTFWIGGPTWTPLQAKLTAGIRDPNKGHLEKMQDQVKQIIKGPPTNRESGHDAFRGRVMKTGRNMFISTPSGVPIISDIPISYLDPFRVYSDEEPRYSGICLCVGYGAEGLALGMGIAEVVSSIINRRISPGEMNAFGVQQYLI